MTAALPAIAWPVPQEDDAGNLQRHLDPVFLAGAGWNPQTQTLAPSPDHPLLGFRICLVRGCQGQGLLPDTLGSCAAGAVPGA